MNTPTKGEGQIEIPAEFKTWMRAESLRLYPAHDIGPSPCGQDYEVLDALADARDQFEKIASSVYRHLSPSIDRYPRWIKASERLPAIGKGVIIRAENSRDNKYIIRGENSGDPEMWDTHDSANWFYYDTEWLEEEQPSESPATTDK